MTTGAASSALRTMRRASCFASRRSMSSAPVAETPGPRLPIGNDPSAFHPREHALADAVRWRRISMIFAVPVAAFGIIQATSDHVHTEEPPEYPYLRRSTRTPRFPWGDDDLFGTPADRAKKRGGH